MLPDPAALLADAPRVREALERAGWSAAALQDLLGAGHREHLDRGELAPLLRRTRQGGPLATLARLLVAGVPVAAAAARDAGLPTTWLQDAGSGTVSCPVRVQAVVHDSREVQVPHDPGDGPTTARNQVLGVGAASLTLASATPRDPVRRALDVGTGSGVQALLLRDSAQEVVATDANPRAVALAGVAAALNGVQLDLRQGDLLAPAQGQRFDLVVSNPPFVIGPRARYTYRDAGLPGDEVGRRLVQGLPDVLCDGGVAVLLADWLHLRGQDGDDRVLSWAEGTGCDLRVVQRELAAPEEYVTAWLRDGDQAFGGVGDGPGDGRAYDAWLDWFDAEGVEAVAFGVLTLRKGGQARVLEEVLQPVAPTWGEEVRSWFVRRDALNGDLLATRWRLREDVHLTEAYTRGAAGWQPTGALLQQEAGLRRSGGVDAAGAALLGACDGTRTAAELLAVLAAGTGLTADQAAAQVLPVLTHLVEQGFLVP